MTLHTTPPAHSVVVVGAGFGGLEVAKRLEGAGCAVTLVEPNNFHTFQPLLYQVATAGLDADDVAHPIRKVFQGRADVAVVMARVVDVDLEGRRALLDRGEPLGYDTLVLACGAVSNPLGVDGVDEHAFPLKRLDDALAIRRHVLDRFESTLLDRSLLEDGSLDIVVSGGGPTGVEMAGGLAELYHRVLVHDFPTLPVADARIVLVDPADRLLPAMSPASSERARTALERLGVEVRLGVGVDRVEARRVHLGDGSIVPAHTTVWVTGVKAAPLGAAIGLGTARGGRVVVDDDLSVPGHPEVFVIGDLAAAHGGTPGPLPQVAQPAIQGGRHVAEQIRRRIAGRPTRPFRYVDKGSMATIGRREAVTELPGGRRLSGTIGWVAWLGLHLVYLMGFRNRLNVFVNWCWNYLTYDRGSRILAEPWRSPDHPGQL